MIRVCVYPAQNESAVEINNALSNCEGIEVFGIAPIRGHNEFNFLNYTLVDLQKQYFCYNNSMKKIKYFIQMFDFLF